MALYAQAPGSIMADTSAPIEHRFDPYQDNGGSILAIAGADFTVIAGDTRQSLDYNIQTRYARKVWQLTDNAVLATNGFAADGKNFVKRVKQRLEVGRGTHPPGVDVVASWPGREVWTGWGSGCWIVMRGAQLTRQWYEHSHGKQMPLKAIARMIQTMLYGRRFFPYYVYNILGGIEADGTGAVYSYDPVGSYEREACRAAGAAQSLVQPFLDNQIYFKNQNPEPGAAPQIPGNLPLSTVLELIIDTFTSATERHIEVGDYLEMYVVMKEGRSTDDLLGEGQLPKDLKIEELGSLGEGTGNRTFLIKRALKRD